MPATLQPHCVKAFRVVVGGPEFDCYYKFLVETDHIYQLDVQISIQDTSALGFFYDSGYQYLRPTLGPDDRYEHAEFEWIRDGRLYYMTNSGEHIVNVFYRCSWISYIWFGGVYWPVGATHSQAHVQRTYTPIPCREIKWTFSMTPTYPVSGQTPDINLWQETEC